MADAALHLPAQEGSVVALGVQGLAADGPLFFGIEEEEVGRIAGLEAVEGQIEDLGRAHAPEAVQVGLADDALAHQLPC